MPGKRLRTSKGFRPGNSLGDGRKQHHQQPAFIQEPLRTPCLRTRPQTCTSEMGDMRLVHIDKVVDMWNFAISDHWHGHKKQSHSPPQFQIAQEVKRGTVVGQSLKCKTRSCNYTTPMHSLFEEVVDKCKPGRNAAVTNIALDMETVNCALGPSKIRNILSALDIPVPAESGMNRRGKETQAKIIAASKEDMHERLTEESGPQKEVNISLDTRYNACGLRSSRRTGMLTTTSATTFAIGRNTKKIVAEDTQNKLCMKGALLKSKGTQGIVCGDSKSENNHVGCTANLGKFDSVSEATAGERIGQSMAASGVTVKEITTDGDSRLLHGVQRSMK